MRIPTTLAACLAFGLATIPQQGVQAMETTTAFPKGERAPAQVFTNTTWVAMLHTDEDGSFDTQVYNVTFEPAARTHWHSHPGGQILLITAGAGYYQEKGGPARRLGPGDTVAIPADVVHWHGAAPDQEFVHLGMSTQVHKGPAAWFGPVTDEEYGDATSE